MEKQFLHMLKDTTIILTFFSRLLKHKNWFLWHKNPYVLPTNTQTCPHMFQYSKLFLQINKYLHSIIHWTVFIRQTCALNIINLSHHIACDFTRFQITPLKTILNILVALFWMSLSSVKQTSSVFLTACVCCLRAKLELDPEVRCVYRWVGVWEDFRK